MIESAVLGIQIQDASDNIIFSYNNIEDDLDITLRKNQKMSISLKTKNIFHNGTYTISAALKSNDRSVTYDQVLKTSKFEISGWRISTAFTHPKMKVTYDKQD